MILHIALEAQSPPIAQDAILGLALLQLRCGEAEQAYELAYFVLNHAPPPEAHWKRLPNWRQ